MYFQPRNSNWKPVFLCPSENTKIRVRAGFIAKHILQKCPLLLWNFDQLFDKSGRTRKRESSQNLVSPKGICRSLVHQASEFPVLNIIEFRIATLRQGFAFVITIIVAACSCPLSRPAMQGSGTALQTIVGRAVSYLNNAVLRLGDAMANATSSTAQDLARGKPTEID